MRRRSKFYVVWKGRQTGLFDSWAEAAAQVNGFPGAQYKAFATRAEAERALREGYAKVVSAQAAPRRKQARLLGIAPPVVPSYCVDAACRGNPGVLEYRCVNTATGAEIFARGPFVEGTNNIGEFLAIVEALMLCRRQGLSIPIYSDSDTARAWVRAKKCNTQLARSERNAKLFERIARAEAWLQKNTYPNPILKWDTEHWGESPADYGRKED